MNALTRWLLGSLSFVAACPVLYGQTRPEVDPAERVLRSHAAFLNELSDRRRLNSFFPNEQSPFYGVPIRYVNSSRGNLTFVRRDLVTAGRIPIVLARVYDSSLRLGNDFGPGWHLSLAETIVRRSDGTLSYVDDSASKVILVRHGNGYAPRYPGLTDIASIEARDDALRVSHRSGWTKLFKQIDDRFVLAAIRDPHGNTLTIRYRGKRLSRIEAQNGRFVAVEWGESGRISRIADDQRRSVSYAYNSRGALETVTDLGGNRWQYAYDGLGRLERVIDPRNVASVEVAFDSDSRVRNVQILGAKFQYTYEEGSTSIRDEANRVTRVSHNRHGIATSLTNPLGFVSEVLLDERNRVTTLRHSGSLRAAFTYGPRGWIDKLTRFEDTGAVDLAYEYDASGRPIRITGADGSSLALEYTASGDVLRKRVGEETLEYEYTPQGDLRSVTQAGETTVYTHNADGQIETIRSPRGATRLTYFPDGKVQSIQFADGAVHQYRYNTLGFRERVERSGGTGITYEYDVAGNLIRSDGENADGKVSGQVFEINESNQAETIRFASGDILQITYDASGNPETITTPDPLAPALEYLYDGTNRVVAVQDGDAISGSYLYKDTEPDLRIQLDDRTMRVGSGAVRQSASVGDILSVAYTRPYGSLLDTVRFDEATQTFDLASDFGLSLPDAVRSNSLTRRKLVQVDAGGVEPRVNFDRPSNVMFLPPEYATINCAANCSFNGIILTGNGTAGSLTVPVGSLVTLSAAKVPGSTCQNIAWDWWINGVPLTTDGGGLQFHTFTTVGSHLVRVEGECTTCNIIRFATLTVNVVCSATVSVTSPPDNPSPTDAAWQTNSSFLSTDTISGVASTSPNGASSGVQWTITPTIGAIQNVVPANGTGPNISFRPNVTHPAYTPGAGSLSPSTALSYSMRAAVCSSQATHTITQDQRDTIRQEYANHGITIPARADLTTVAGTAHFSASDISQSEYSLMVGNPGALGEAVRTEYNQRLRTALANPNFPEQGIGMSSGYRNPERNEAIGSTQVASIHQYGRATDLQILQSTVTASGLTTAQVWQILADAGAAVATGFCEIGPTATACNVQGVTHVHVQN